MADPLKGQSVYGRALFEKMAAVANGFGYDDVIDASVNIMLNALRQNHTKRAEVEARFNEIAGRAKQNLLNFYDPVSGKRRTTIPFDQHIVAPLHVDPDKIRGQ